MSTAATDAPGGGNPSALPPGTRLAEFEVRRVVGIGGFGIVYLAFDHALEREVAIKEYMPSSLVGRTASLHVSLRSQADAETFDIGLRSFVNEARLLASFDHPSLLKVLRFWEDNGTAYMAMPVLRGQTLKQMRQAASQAPDEAWMRGLLASMLDALERLHGAQVFHRDIAPDNIQIEPDGRAVLLDFGAARRVASDKSQTLTAILKPAYAPIEQYGEAGSVKQGPWTDFYALGATLHFLLLGRPPAPATARTLHDEAPSLVQKAPPGYSVEFLSLVDWMLAPKPADRPQNVAALREALQGRRAAPAHPGFKPTATPAADPDETVVMTRPPLKATLLATPAAPARSSKALLWGGGAALLAMAAAAFALLGPAAAPPDLPANPVAAVVAPAPQPASEPAAPPAVEPAPEPAALNAAQAVTSTVPTPPAAADAAAALPKPDAAATARPARPAEAAPAAPAALVRARADAVANPAGPRGGFAASAASAVQALAPEPQEPAVAKSPEEVCSTRPHVRYFACMERLCWRAENRQHADCRKWRQDMPGNP